MVTMRKVLLTGLVAATFGISTMVVAVPGNAAPPEAHIPGQIIVKFRDNGAAPGVLRQHGLSQGPGIGDTGAHLIKVPGGKELQLVNALSRNPGVEYAEPDGLATATTSDTYFASQYALQNDGQSFTNTAGDIVVAGGTPDADVDAVEAWPLASGANIKVAVLDSGVDANHVDLRSKIDARANFSSAATQDDNYGHGTAVAGIVGAAHNTEGVAGVCPGCRILDGKVLNDSGSGSASGIANGINWAVNNGAKVINMSLGMRSSRTLQTAVIKAWDKGVVLVAAAGNGGNTTKLYPAAYPNVIAVGATDNRDAKASFSTYDASWVDVAAPGVNVYSTFPSHNFYLMRNGRSMMYDVGNGTSMSSPIVAAVAALAWSKSPAASNVTVRSTIESTADKSVAGTGTYWAHGRVNAYNAVK